MSSRLYIITGASGSGKTTLLNSIASSNILSADTVLRAVRAPKYSEREVRTNQGDLDDIVHVENVRLGDFDIAYVINNIKYGIKLKPINELLRNGFNPFIIVSDFRIVRQLKALLGEKAKALYVSSAIDADKLRRIQFERLGFKPTEKQKTVLSYHFSRASAAARLGWWERVSECMTELEADWHAYATDAKSTEIRAQKIRAFHIRYIEHISLFDHVILNYTEDKPEEMAFQVSNLIQHVDRYESIELSSPPIFIVAAASGAGKGTLMEMLEFIGKDRVKITSKLAKRRPKKEDKRDGMIALFRTSTDPKPEWPEWWTNDMKEFGNKGEFPPEYDLRWEFHKKHPQGGGGTHYAVSSQEINRNLSNKTPQIFISNIEQFETFRKKWPKNSIFVYLHRLVSDHDYREFQIRKWKEDPTEAQARILERAQIHRSYMSSIAQFNHVLLNTANEEDLYDQMFRLLEYYNKG